MTYACQFTETDHSYLLRRSAAGELALLVGAHCEDGHALVLSDDSL
jgi:uncharacterized protein involved in type VI secretion and phage assembly